MCRRLQQALLVSLGLLYCGSLAKNPVQQLQARRLAQLVVFGGSAENCTWIEDIDFHGGRYAPAGKGAGMTREQCCQACQADTLCDFAVLAGPKARVPGACWLKSLGAVPFHRPGDLACCPGGTQCQHQHPVQPTPTVREKDVDTDYDCCDIFNSTHPPPAGWRARYPASAPGIKATGRNDTVPAYNLSMCIEICAELYHAHGVQCRAAAWNAGAQQCYLKWGKGNLHKRTGDTSFLLGTTGPRWQQQASWSPLAGLPPLPKPHHSWLSSDPGLQNLGAESGFRPRKSTSSNWGVQILCIFNQNQTPRSDSANLEPTEPIFYPPHSGAQVRPDVRQRDGPAHTRRGAHHGQLPSLRVLRRQRQLPHPQPPVLQRHRRPSGRRSLRGAGGPREREHRHQLLPVVLRLRGERPR